VSLRSPLLAAALAVASAAGPLAFAGSARAATPELVIYAYDSFMAPGGLGPEIFPLFEKRCGCKVKALASGDGAQLVSRLELDAKRGKPTAAVVVGLDQHLWARARGLTEPWRDWSPIGYADLPVEVRVEPGFLPFDYGAFALMADGQGLAKAGVPAPASPRDLTKPQYRRRFLLEDPRTSTPGLAFLLYTQELLKDGAPAYWKSLLGQWLTLAPGWDQAYGLFLKGEAPLVWSYVTSQAYHAEHGDASGRYLAVLFDEGQPIQIEGAALVKGALGKPAELARARSFLEFLLDAEVQTRIPRKNWMMPVVPGTKLPESFQKLPRPKRLVRIPQASLSPEAQKSTLDAWGAALRGGS
jgi:thiamine transport system substrate-binding protein